MRKLLTVIFALSVTPALAQADVYGSDVACKRYVQGGIERVYEPSAEAEQDSPYLLVGQGKVIGLEWACSTGLSSDELPSALVMQCASEGVEYPWTAEVTYADASLIYEDANGRVTLARCE